MALDKVKGVWKTGKGKGRKTPKGRQLDDDAYAEVIALIGTGPLRRDLLIEYLHLIQDKYNCLSSAHINALAMCLRISESEVYEVATFYAHFDVVKEDEPAPPEVTIRVCDSLSCELQGAKKLIKELKKNLDKSKIRVVRAPCMGRCDTAPTMEIGHNHVDCATLKRAIQVIETNDYHPKIPDYRNLQTYLAEDGYKTLHSYRNGQVSSDEVQ